MASFIFMVPGQPMWLRVVQLAVFGAVNSLQFTVMNTVTLRDWTAISPARATACCRW